MARLNIQLTVGRFVEQLNDREMEDILEELSLAREEKFENWLEAIGWVKKAGADNA